MRHLGEFDFGFFVCFCHEHTYDRKTEDIYGCGIDLI